MISVGIKELKNRLSHYLSHVKQGQDVLITDRGKVVARLVKEGTIEANLRKRLQPLILKGVISYPKHGLNRSAAEPIEIGGKPVSEMVTENRR